MQTLESLKISATTPINYLQSTAYDFTKWNLGSGICLDSSGGEYFLTPIFKSLQPMEESVAFACMMPFVHKFSETDHYLFLAENSTTASATRRVRLYRFNPQTLAVISSGFITMTLATATAHTIRDFKVDYKAESTGTVAVSGTAVTGTGTLFTTNRVAIGARIGFGSTDPKLITTWFRITARVSDTGITIESTAGTISAGTAYVIEEYRPILVCTNATTTNGGIHISKGVSPQDFITSGTTIALATTVDDIKATYWIKDAVTQTNLVAGGAYMADATGVSAREISVLDVVAASTVKFYRYNIRAALTLTAGAATNAFTFATGNQVVTGGVPQLANLVGCIAAHGAGNGVLSYYFVTTTRIYRSQQSLITNGSTTFLSDNISEIPTGGVNTYAATNTLNSINYNNMADSFNVMTTGTVFNYMTKYVTSGQQFSKIYGRNLLNLEQSIADTNNSLHFSLSGQPFTAHDMDNMVYLSKNGPTVSTNQIYITAFGADWDNAANVGFNGFAISPRLTPQNAVAFVNAMVTERQYIGNTVFTKPTEPFKIFFRTANITADISTGWTELGRNFDLSGFGGASECQIKIVWKTVGEICVPARITGLAVVYNNKMIDSKWVGSDEKSVAASKEFAFRQITQYGSVYPTLTVELVDSVSGSTLVTSLSTTQLNGVWQKSTDGTAWVAFNATDRVAGARGDNTFIRFTPTAALTGKIRAVLY